MTIGEKNILAVTLNALQNNDLISRATLNEAFKVLKIPAKYKRKIEDNTFDFLYGVKCRQGDYTMPNKLQEGSSVNRKGGNKLKDKEMNNAAKKTETDYIERYYFACKIAKDKSILDVACGSGYSTPLFINAGSLSYDGIDIDEKQIASAKSRYAGETYLNNKANYHVGDMRTFNNGKTFDIITCYEVIEHVKDYESAIRNLYSLLNPGGVLLISTPNRLISSPDCLSIDDKPLNKSHTQEFTPNELLSTLICSGFEVNQDKVFGQHQRRVYSNKFVDKIVQAILKKVKKRDTAVVSEVKNKIPEHFIIAATKT